MQPIDWIRRCFPVFAVLWALELPLAAGLRANAATSTSTPVRLMSGAVYAAGAVICHQRPERSFSWAGQPWPVCARCTGIYAGAAVAAFVISGAMRPTSGVRRSSEGTTNGGDRSIVRTAVLLALIPTVLTLVWEWITASTPPNGLRALAGLPIGVVVAWVVLRTPRRDAQSG